MATENNVNKDENPTGIKKLHGLLDGNEFGDFQKRIADIRKRVEKLYSAERARLNKLSDARARAEEEERAAIEAAARAAATPQPEPEPERVEEPSATVEQPVGEPEALTAEAIAQQPEKAEKPTDEKAKPQVKLGIAIEQPQSTTRTAIPSYIKGVVKHTPRPADRPRDGRPPRTPSQRPQSGAGQTSRPPLSRPVMPPKFEAPATPRKRETPGAKKTFVKPSDDKRQMSKRMLIRKGYIQEDIDEERMGTRKLKNKKANKVVPFAPIKIENAVITTENLTVKILSEKIGKTAQEIIKQLMELGIMTTINSVVDFPTMQLVADALGVSIELKLEKTKEEELSELHAEPDPEELLVKRPPIVTVMGHVDHGKTSLLDAIRKTSVASGEAGGITQHIGAYSVDMNGEKITFLDTPGHEAFTEMRKRGATVTDIAVLIVAADDGVMPQTEEAIKHAQDAGVPIVVAINKIDKPGANPDRIIQQLAERGLMCEEWGGDVPMIPISAKQNIGIDKLLEQILFRAEYMELRANPERGARGYVIEARLDKGKGPIATVIVQNGTLHVGDYIVSGTTYGRVRSLTDDKGRSIKSAGPSMPVAVFGLAQVPMAGDPIVQVESEKMARQVIEERTVRAKNEMLSDVPSTDIDVLFGRRAEAQAKELRVIIKADVQGSSEALEKGISKLSGDEVKVTVVRYGVGAITQSDVMLADVSKAVIIGFNVKPDSEGRTAADRMGVKIKQFGVIYDALDYVAGEVESMTAPKYVEVVTGKAQVRGIFKVSGVGMVAGCYVQQGKIVRNGKARIYRKGKQIFDGNIIGLKRFKDDAKEVTIGLECGIAFADFADYAEDDEVECYVMERETSEKR